MQNKSFLVRFLLYTLIKTKLHRRSMESLIDGLRRSKSSIFDDHKPGEHCIDEICL